MRIWLRNLLTIGTAGFVIVVGGLAYVVWSAVREHVWEARTPVSREKAQANCPIPLPASAHNVQYAWVVGGLQYTVQYVRFEAPVEDCYAEAQRLFADYARIGSRSKTPQFLATDHPIRPPTCPDLHTEWFDVDAMPEGVVAGSEGSYAPQIWIDTKRGVFYFYLTD